MILESPLTDAVEDDEGETEEVLNPDKGVTEDGATAWEWTRRLLVVMPEEFEVKLDAIPDVELEIVELMREVLKDMAIDCDCSE